MHDFKQFPELTDSQMDFYYFNSPHKQIFENFRAKVVKVHDGDTITLRWNERDFDFPVRFSNIAAPELKEPNGKVSQSWLENKLLGKEVDIIIDPKNRVERWGRLLGRVELMGLDIGEESILSNKSVAWAERNSNKLPTINKMIGNPLGVSS